MLETVRAYAAERFAARARRRDRCASATASTSSPSPSVTGADRALRGPERPRPTLRRSTRRATTSARLSRWAVERRDPERALAPDGRPRYLLAIAQSLRRGRRMGRPGVGAAGRRRPSGAPRPATGPQGAGRSGHSGERPKQSALVEEAVAAARACRAHPLVLSQVLTMSADRAWAMGQLDVARAHADEALEYATQAGGLGGSPWPGRERDGGAPTIADLRERTDRAAGSLPAAGNATTSPTCSASSRIRRAVHGQRRGREGVRRARAHGRHADSAGTTAG